MSDSDSDSAWEPDGDSRSRSKKKSKRRKSRGGRKVNSKKRRKSLKGVYENYACLVHNPVLLPMMLVSSVVCAVISMLSLLPGRNSFFLQNFPNMYDKTLAYSQQVNDI